MLYTIQQSQKILYNGDNQDEVQKFFKDYIKENKFDKAPILTYKHNHGKFDLLVNQGNANFRTFIIPHNRWLSFSKLNNNEIILNIELNYGK